MLKKGLAFTVLVDQDACISNPGNPKSVVWGHGWEEEWGGSVPGSLGESGDMGEAAEVMGETAISMSLAGHAVACLVV